MIAYDNVNKMAFENWFNYFIFWKTRIILLKNNRIIYYSLYFWLITNHDEGEIIFFANEIIILYWWFVAIVAASRTAEYIELFVENSVRRDFLINFGLSFARIITFLCFWDGTDASFSRTRWLQYPSRASEMNFIRR